jgi:hypothetical protein
LLSFAKKFGREHALRSHNVKYQDSPGIFPVEDATGWLDDLAITPAFELLWL